MYLKKQKNKSEDENLLSDVTIKHEDHLRKYARID